MQEMKRFASRKLRINPEQVQIFTPTPSTYSSLMYYTEMDPFTRKKIFVEKDIGKRKRQKAILTQKKKTSGATSAHRKRKAPRTRRRAR